MECKHQAQVWGGGGGGCQGGVASYRIISLTEPDIWLDLSRPNLIWSVACTKPTTQPSDRLSGGRGGGAIVNFFSAFLLCGKVNTKVCVAQFLLYI